MNATEKHDDTPQAKLELDSARMFYQSHYNAIDAEVATKYPCGECGSANMHYEGFKKGDTYRAFAVCDDCGHASEF